MVSPLTGRVETVRVEVSSGDVIHWDDSPVTPSRSSTHMTAAVGPDLGAPDGLVLRQEVPFPSSSWSWSAAPSRARHRSREGRGRR